MEGCEVRSHAITATQYTAGDAMQHCVLEGLGAMIKFDGLLRHAVFLPSKVQNESPFAQKAFFLDSRCSASCKAIFLVSGRFTQNPREAK